MAQQKHEVPDVQRVVMISVAVAEIAFKTVALIDLAFRPAEKVRGPKAAWAAGIALINGFGVAPAAYFLFGRNRRPTDS